MGSDEEEIATAGRSKCGAGKITLLTGAGGKLGRAILKSEASARFQLLTPLRRELDVARKESVEAFFNANEIDGVIHCAAAARMGECERDPAKAIETNVIGAANLVIETLRHEKRRGASVRFTHISTDGVYAGETGGYSEKSATIPYNKYGWSKLGAECSVNMLSDFCIVRTSFFDPGGVRFDESADDMFSSKLPIDELAAAILAVHESGWKGTINIGGERMSDFERYSGSKPSLRRCKREEVTRDLPFKMAADASMDCTLWNELKNRIAKAD